MYLSSTAVVMSELLKCAISLMVHLQESSNKARELPLPRLGEPNVMVASTPLSARQLYNDILSVKSGFLRLLVPASLYTLQNNLQYVAATNLDAATFQVTYQCKILTTALFAVLLLHQPLSWLKWLSLAILTIGVACVQIPSTTTTQKPSALQRSYLYGIFAVAIACLCSGFAGVYFEKVLKTSNNTTSLWVRNIQLSLGCLGIALIGTITWDGRAIAEAGFFQGYRLVTVATIAIQAAGGLIVALVIKYADNILKGFATSLSIILSTVLSVWIFDFIVTPYFLLGAALVFVATYLYSVPNGASAVPVEMLQTRYDEDHDHDDPAAPMLGSASYDDHKAGQEPALGLEHRERTEIPALAPSPSPDASPKRVPVVYDELGYVD
jgi:solute carrier family 35 (UDP-sugar transporter), member A1/2/3